MTHTSNPGAKCRSVGPADQAGMTLISWLFVIIVLGFLALIVMKLVPMYLESMKVGHAVESMVKEARLSEMSESKIRESLMRRLDIDDVRRFERKPFKEFASIRKRGAKVTITFDYEAREELFGNVSLLVHFVKSASN